MTHIVTPRFFRRTVALVPFFLIALLFASCHTGRRTEKPDYRELVKAGRKLDMRIDYKDHHALFVESAKWLGVPYRYGGKSRAGVDCSGLTTCIYQNVYGIRLSPNSQMQLDRDVQQRVGKSHLKQGDLVFFSSRRSRKRINHVGIYLKDGRFIHASTTRGVRLDRLDDKHWKRQWVTGGRVKR